MHLNFLTSPLSGSQELGVILGIAVLVVAFWSFAAWLRRQRVRLVVVRKSPATVVTFPPEPTAYLRDLGHVEAYYQQQSSSPSRPVADADDQPEATDALYDVNRWLGEQGR